MIPSQMLKGTLEGCILKVISREEVYGYEISQRLQQFGFADISEGTIYPLLLRLEKGRLINAVYRQSPVGPKRKYFSLTQEGYAELDKFHENWQQLERAISALFYEGDIQNEQKNK